MEFHMSSSFKYLLNLAFLLSMVSIGQVAFAANCDTLKPGQAAFFEHSKYRGACVVRNIGRYSNSQGIGIGNDKISSIKVGPSTQLKLCKDNNFKGGCSTWTKSTASLGWWNDKTSSAIIEKILPKKDTSVQCRPNDNQVAVFEHVDYKGACSVLGVGNYNNSSQIGVANDTISSVLVGRNVAIVGYKNTNFRSTNFYSDKNIPYIVGPKSKIPLQGKVVPANAPGGGDAISSIKVIKLCR
jgi:hypothetical protein